MRSTSSLLIVCAAILARISWLPCKEHKGHLKWASCERYAKRNTKQGALHNVLWCTTNFKWQKPAAYKGQTNKEVAGVLQARGMLTCRAMASSCCFARMSACLSTSLFCSASLFAYKSHFSSSITLVPSDI